MFSWSTTLKKVNVLRKGTKRLSKKTEEFLLAFHQKAKNSVKNQFYSVPFYGGWSLLNEVLLVSYTP